MNKNWYPIKFEPILKDKIWGGRKLKTLLNKKSASNSAGESWEISDVEGDVSIVSNGWLSGKSLKEVLSEYKSDFVGRKVFEEFGNSFPLLIKFIDASSDLSVQLHPNDQLAQERHNSFGKTEMWHIIQSDIGSRLILGFNEGVDLDIYERHLEQKSLPEILGEVEVKEGDTFFIPTGTVHAIGAGIVLAEIQQTSDITYRVYDWDRKDDFGNERQLHQKEAVAAINFDFNGERATYDTTSNRSNQMVSCDYFTTNYLPVSGIVTKDYENLDSFVIYMCVQGEVSISGNGFEETISYGETVLIPASLNNIKLTSEGAKLLEVFV